MLPVRSPSCSRHRCGARARTVGRTGLQIHGAPSYEHWRGTGLRLATLGDAVRWAIGDWLIYGEGRGEWGETYTQAAEETHIERETLRKYRVPR